jgi:hypothetical protein
MSGQSSSSSDDDEGASSKIGGGSGVLGVSGSRGETGTRGESGVGVVATGARPATTGSGVPSVISASGAFDIDGSWFEGAEAGSGSVIWGTSSGEEASSGSDSSSGSSKPNGLGTSSSSMLDMPIQMCNTGGWSQAASASDRGRGEREASRVIGSCSKYMHDSVQHMTAMSQTSRKETNLNKEVE